MTVLNAEPSKQRTAIPPDLLNENLYPKQLRDLVSEMRKERKFDELLPLLLKQDGAAVIAERLPQVLTPAEIEANYDTYRAWEAIGLWFLNQGRAFEALGIFWGLYSHLLEFQKAGGKRSAGKATPLIWISDCHRLLGHGAISRRFLMLALCEDAITCEGKLPPERTGVYRRAVWQHGMSDSEFQRYAREAYRAYSEDPSRGVYPESVLQDLDEEWMTVLPSPNEAMLYPSNPHYLQFLLARLGAKSGKELERLAAYILSAMPGCHVTRRRTTRSTKTDYDIVCSVEGVQADFRTELGRYFVGECKDWERRVDFTVMAKFCRILDSIKCRFGILFSRRGITGSKTRTGATAEQMRILQDRGIVIVVVEEADLHRIADGANFVTMLRSKYEGVRLES